MTYKGLSSAEAEASFEKWGPNEIVHVRKLSAVEDFFSRFTNPLVLILLVAAILSGFLGDKISAITIIAIVLLSLILDFVNTHKSQKAAEALKNQVTTMVDVIRDGKHGSIPLSEIVPGDVVLLAPGNIVPADGTVLEAKDFFINESSLTGESFPIEKGIGDGVVMGSGVTTGNAVVRAVSTGTNTKFSHIAAALSARQAPTEFDRSIKSFSSLIIKVTFVLVTFIFLVNALFRHDFLQSFLFSIALAIGLTPELLPVIISLNLSKGSLAMAKHGVIVKKLSSIQNFGSMDVLCTDKTGTLTEDRITLFKYIDAAGVVSEDVFDLAYLSSAYSSGSENPLDSAIIDFHHAAHERVAGTTMAQTAGQNKADQKGLVKMEHELLSEYKKIDEIPFDYERKRTAIVVEKVMKNGKPGLRTLISKGAPEELVKVCSFGVGARGKAAQEKVMALYHSLSQDGYRVLALAAKPLKVKKEEKEAEARKEVYSKNDETSMKFMGFLAFLDPAKKTVTETLAILEKQGIEIKILTGDNELVTKKIADDIRLPVRGILTGTQMESLHDGALETAIKNTTIFARVSPEQKEKIIKALQRAGRVVGYMGDGINDAPSLKAADVGISVNNAVDISREAADIILLKKGLDTLVRGVQEGRKTFANTMKYLMMDLSSNFGNMFSMAGASLILPFLPMLPSQILFNNMLYDTSQFAIPLDNVDMEYIQQPTRFSISFIKKFMVIFGILSSLFDFITFFTFYFFFHFGAGPFQTAWFLESITTQTFVVYIIRTRKIPFLQSSPSRILVASTVGVVIVAWLMVFLPVGSFLEFTPLSIGSIVAIIIITAAYLVLSQYVKEWFYRRIVKTP
jgi:Mg2+-importing ATPase